MYKHRIFSQVSYSVTIVLF